MVLLNSNPTPAGVLMPAFALQGIDGKLYRSEEYSHARALVIMFLCGHCPYVQAVEERIVALARYFQGPEVQFLAICSNDPRQYPDDGPAKLRERAEKCGYGFPYLIDESQQVARDFGAVCTPEFFLYDSSRKLRYHGRLDDSWKDPQKVRREDLKEAIESVLAGRDVPKDPKPSMGCSIKWKEGA
ncbi:MAG: thioredoxin family protein [Candidatus Omnitrophota bacterium]